ncbi:hypothetical protein SEA_RAHALELUJAH_43 [Mycobacterium phage Rahalelujah]|nr:hypothetical protein SEA_RAHALELUJAH_43 [Mycobacterium phage Rahalelujah]
MTVIRPFGEKFAGISVFSARCVEDIGQELVYTAALDSFRHGLRRNPEAVVAFEHTIKQKSVYDVMRDQWAVRTEAVVLRAQLAIEGPK